MPSAFAILGLLICGASIGYADVLVGAPLDQNAGDPEFMEQAWMAVTKVNEESNEGGYYMVPTKVLSAKTQVVAGIIYTSTVLFEESSCKKTDVSVAELRAANCEPMKDGKRAIYEVSVFEQPWLNSEQVNVKELRVLAPGEQHVAI
nr:Proteinase inhibitor I25 domain containing protein [Haemonchus contortus]